MLNNIMAVHLLVRDLAKCTEFYRDTLGLKVRDSWSTPDSIAFEMDNPYFWVLEAAGVAGVVSEEPLDLKGDGGPRVMLTTSVEDVDAAYEELKAKGVGFLRPPTDQPFGMRTAYFADPEGNLWEINQRIARTG